jgi:hypothetical protein
VSRMTGWTVSQVEDRCKVRRPSCASSRTERRYLNRPACHQRHAPQDLVDESAG